MRGFEAMSERNPNSVGKKKFRACLDSAWFYSAVSNSKLVVLCDTARGWVRGHLSGPEQRGGGKEDFLDYAQFTQACRKCAFVAVADAAERF